MPLNTSFLPQNWALTCLLVGVLSACQTAPSVEPSAPEAVSSQGQNTSDALTWPTVIPGVPADPAIEKRIATLLDRLTLQQKVAQMIQADIGSVTPEEMTQYRLGSVLNGGGQTPNDDANATPQMWASFADELYRASIEPVEGQVPIPVMWGVDAVHGHGNVRGATLYPHNIALGATRNPDLVKKIAEATALEVAATGLDWNFAPSVAVARDIRWGRTYESYAQDPALVATLGAAAVEGLQGAPRSAQWLNEAHVLATAKHFIGDGGTAYGDDQGVTLGDEQTLIRTHLPGYVAAIEAGVQTIMASYSWWDEQHSHANRILLTDVLKGKLGFDGLVVSDWQGIAHIDGCTIDNCPQAINAGVDLFMIPNAPEWKRFYYNTLAQVRAGKISVARIDDAVSRILRVKMRAGLWSKPSPAYRGPALKWDTVGNVRHRALARQAVRESLVLLKDPQKLLPLKPNQRILVAGDAAMSISQQAGGWSVTWLGRDNPNSMYPGATTIFAGIEQAVNEAGGEAVFSPDGTATEPADVAIVVFGERPYAEMYGDIQNLDTLEFEQHDKKSLRLIQRLKKQGVPVVSIFLSGRPLWVNKELNASDAFVVAWQPGTEGQGVADVILAKNEGSAGYDFKGKLPFEWPESVCDAVVGEGDEPLFGYGFGLTYSSEAKPWSPVHEDTSTWQYGCRLGAALPVTLPEKLNARNGWWFSAEQKSLVSQRVAGGEVSAGGLSAKPIMDGVVATWDGTELGRLLLRNGKKDNNFLPFLANNGSIVFDLYIGSQPTEQTFLTLFSGHLAGSQVDVTEQLKNLAPVRWHHIAIDLKCFTDIRADLNKVDSPFGIETAGRFKVGLKNVSYQPHNKTLLRFDCPKP